ncbi:Lrp/AsnC family transcriptional regulator [Ahrensia marina]|uniref:Lrp/AsnC family transcriptional regulator n=1 Tax=Ahrensia marina TaxID=1514904 RepID=UPI0035CFB8FF
MDNQDIAIVSELRRNARASISDLAVLVGLSRATVRNRLERLQKEGTIVGFTAILADDVREHPVRGLMMLGIEGRGTDRITRTITGLADVKAVHSTNGKWDLIVEIGTQTLEDLDSVITKVRKLDGVMTSETNLLLTTHMTTRAR